MINPEEQIPSYLHINKIDLVTNPAIHGTNSNKITDAWVYVDGSLIGVYELPATLPVLTEGEHSLIIKPGILVNGISNTHAYYPFFQQFETKFTFVEGEVRDVNVQTSYFPETVNWIEGFEDGGITIERMPGSDTAIKKTNDPSQVFEGNYCGMIALTSEYDRFLGASTGEFQFKKGNDPVFLELNYKTNNSLAVGVYALVPGDIRKIPVIVLNPKDNWNKIYINLTGAVSTISSTSNFRIYFEMFKDSDVDFPLAYIDNIKLVYNRP